MTDSEIMEVICESEKRITEAKERYNNSTPEMMDCPKCGNSAYVGRVRNSNNKLCYRVECRCGFLGKSFRKKLMAIAEWNKKWKVNPTVTEKALKQRFDSMKDSAEPSLNEKWVALASSEPVDKKAALVASESWEPKHMEVIKL